MIVNILNFKFILETDDSEPDWVSEFTAKKEFLNEQRKVLEQKEKKEKLEEKLKKRKLVNKSYPQKKKVFNLMFNFEIV